MSNAMLNIFVRVVSRRLESGESVDDVLDSYPKLTEEEKEKIKLAVSQNCGDT